MDKIRVYIDGVEVGYYSIEDTGVAFTWQAKLIDEINSFSVTTTKTLTLPLTKELNKLLKNPSVIDTTDSLSNRGYWSIDVMWNDTLAIRGWVKLQQIVILNNDEYVEITVEPREKSWIEQFKNKNVTQLDFTTGTSQAHSLTYANIVASETFLSTREYVYAPIDIGEVGRLQVLWVEQDSSNNTYYYYYGYQVSASTFVADSYGFEETQLNRYDEVFTDVADAFWNARGIYKARTSTTLVPLTYVGASGYMWAKDVDYWQIGDFYPSVRHKNILKRAFNQIGYDVTLIDSSQYFDDKYNFVCNVEQLNKYELERTKLKVRVQDGGFAYTKTSPKSWRIPFINQTQLGLIPDVSKFSDLGSNNSANIDAGTNESKWTATETSIINFKWNYEIKHTLTVPVTVPTTGVDIKLHFRQFDSGSTLRRQTTFNIVSDWSNYSFGIYKGSITYTALLDVGDYVECHVEYMDLWVGGATISILDSNTLETSHYKGGNFKGKVIRLNEYMPDVPIYDYIKDLAFINNWEFYTNEANKHVYIVREDEKRTGKDIDFTKKLNFDSEITLSEVGLLHPKKYYFNWKQDDKDWAVRFIELATRQGLGDTYKENEINLVSRFAVGTIENLNIFRIDIEEKSCQVYAASLDKWQTNNMNFNTVEMYGEETYKSKPTWKRVDYEPRYLRIIFGQTLESNGVGGVASIRYVIGLASNHTTYPRPEFQTPLYFGGSGGLIATKYRRRKKAIQYGWVLKGSFNLTETDVNTFVEVYEDNNFRGDYELQVGGIKKIGELLKVNDFSPSTSDQTELEYIIYRG